MSIDYIRKIKKIEFPDITVEYGSGEIVQINMESFLDGCADKRLAAKILDHRGFRTVKISLGCLVWFGTAFSPSQMYSFATQRQQFSIVQYLRKHPGMYIGATGEDGKLAAIFGVIKFLLTNSTRLEEVVIEIRDENIKISAKDAPLVVPDSKIRSIGAMLTYQCEQHKAFAMLEGSIMPLLILISMSSEFTFNFVANNYSYSQSFRKGVPESEIKEKPEFVKRGFILNFKMDRDIFSPNIPVKKMVEKLKELSYLFPKNEFRLTNDDSQWIFPKNKGMVSYLESLGLYEVPILRTRIDSFELEGLHSVEIAASMVESGEGHVKGFVNCKDVSGGSHIKGAIQGITKALKFDIDPFGSVEEYIALAIRVELDRPNLVGVISPHLVNTDIEKIVEDLVTKELSY